MPIGGERAPQEQRYRYGDVAMPGLLSNLCRRGAQRERLMVKLFGGRARNDGSYEPGVLNADFALAFVNANGLKLIESSLGGQVARWVNFHPASGRTKVRETRDSPAFSASRRTVISLSRKSA
nr:chemotaxis protein CheD [Rhizobium rhizoryzae]